jgi:hypothetical protein
MCAPQSRSARISSKVLRQSVVRQWWMLHHLVDGWLGPVGWLAGWLAPWSVQSQRFHVFHCFPTETFRNEFKLLHKFPDLRIGKFMIYLKVPFVSWSRETHRVQNSRTIINAASNQPRTRDVPPQNPEQHHLTCACTHARTHAQQYPASIHPISLQTTDTDTSSYIYTSSPLG